jgi:DNA-binding protein WhiA
MDDQFAALPPQVVSAGQSVMLKLHGVVHFIAHGSLTEPGRSSSLEITCPGPEAALGTCWCSTSFRILSAKAREVRGVDRVVIRDGDAIESFAYST